MEVTSVMKSRGVEVKFPTLTLACDAQVEAMMEDSAKPRKFQVVIKWAAKVNIAALLDFIE